MHRPAVLAVRNYATLLGVPDRHPAAGWLPLAYAIAAAVGIGWALILMRLKPEVYAAIGLGADAVTGRADALEPRQRPRQGI